MRRSFTEAVAKMSDLEHFLKIMTDEGVYKIIISNPVAKSDEIKKIIVEKKDTFFQISKYTEKQVFHENIRPDGIAERLALLTEHKFRQVNGFAPDKEHIILISKKGVCSYKTGRVIPQAVGSKPEQSGHNRKKQYILKEGSIIEPLIDMGIFTPGGKIVNSMYDKYKQINRFIEILNDEMENYRGKELNIIDFGCGKSYLTFVVYHYLTKIMGIKVHMIGLDLKEDVIKKCNAAAEKYHYDSLHFEVGDIDGYKAPFDVDAVITLHACDVATDFALFNAINWKAKMIFSVPCCQHELNKQISPETLSILSRYGIIKERFSALATDAIRGALLEYCGYKTQLLEFIDFDHTPKNILIRAVLRPITPNSVRKKAMEEVDAVMKEFSFRPMLYTLLQDKLQDGLKQDGSGV